MNKSISVCGSDCRKCYCYKNDMCNGCNDCKGIVFHTDHKECLIYHCCVSEHGFKNCLECEKIPCDIWRKTRDPKYTDLEFENNINERISLLKDQIITNK